jgi:hypothetical protein
MMASSNIINDAWHVDLLFLLPYKKQTLSTPILQAYSALGSSHKLHAH